jgi:hypothetical protein
MKNLLRARIAQLAGIIALVAAIGFFMTACGEDPAPADAPAGYVTLSASSFGPYVDEPLTAVYVPEADEEVVYAFFKDEGSVKDDLEAGNITSDVEDACLRDPLATATWTPTVAGTYFVAVAEKGAYTEYAALIAADPNSTAKPPLFMCSPSITVTVFPFFGTWKMTGANNSNWKPDTGTNTPVSDETIVITKTTFKLDSTFAGYSQGSQYVTLGVSQIEVSTYDLTAANEHVYFNITAWEPITGGDLTVSHTPTGGSATSVTYASGYKLTVSATSAKGYTKFTSFNVFLDNSNTPSLIRRTNQTSAVLARPYVKQ